MTQTADTRTKVILEDAMKLVMLIRNADDATAEQFLNAAVGNAIKYGYQLGQNDVATIMRQQPVMLPITPAVLDALNTGAFDGRA